VMQTIILACERAYRRGCKCIRLLVSEWPLGLWFVAARGFPPRAFRWSMNKSMSIDRARLDLCPSSSFWSQREGSLSDCTSRHFKVNGWCFDSDSIEMVSLSLAPEGCHADAECLCRVFQGSRHREHAPDMFYFSIFQACAGRKIDWSARDLMKYYVR
jgi:hypothetical protein